MNTCLSGCALNEERTECLCFELKNESGFALIQRITERLCVDSKNN